MANPASSPWMCDLGITYQTEYLADLSLTLRLDLFLFEGLFLDWFSFEIYGKKTQVLKIISFLFTFIFRDSNDSNSTKEEKVLTLTNDHRERVRSLVVDQTKEWSDMVVRQVTEEHILRKDHIVQQNECLHKLLLEAQQEQLKELEMRQDRWVVGRD